MVCCFTEFNSGTESLPSERAPFDVAREPVSAEEWNAIKNDSIFDLCVRKTSVKISMRCMKC